MITKSLVTRQLSLQSADRFGKSEARLSSNANQVPKTNHLLVCQKPERSQLMISRCVTTGTDHSHAKMWSAERYLSIGLLAVIPVAFAVPNPALDYLLALSLVTHVHWGVEAIVVDYVRPAIFGPVIPKMALGSVYLLSVLALGGLFYFNYTDVGLVTAIRMLAKM